MIAGLLRPLLLFLCLLAAFPVWAENGELPKKETPGEKSAQLPAAKLADLIPQATQLSERLAALEQALQEIRVPPDAKDTLTKASKRVDELPATLEGLKTSTAYGYDQFAEFKAAVRAEVDTLRALGDALTAVVSRVDLRRSTWLLEKEKWAERLTNLPPDVPVAAVKPTVDAAQKTIDRALARMSEAVDPVLQVQREVGEMLTRLQGLSSEADSALRALRGDIFRKSARAMLTRGFVAQFDGELFDEMRKGIAGTAWPTGEFWTRQGWIVGCQLLLVLVLAGTVRRHHETVEGAEKWRFIRDRPEAAGVFIAVAVLAPLYRATMPPTWRLLLWLVAAVSAVKLLAGLIERHWKRRLLYLLAFVFLASQAFRVFGVPLPFFRLYVFALAFVGAPLCWWRSGVAFRRGDKSVYPYSLRLGSGIFTVVLVAQLLGYSSLATHLLDASIQTTFLVLISWMLNLLLRGGLEFVFSAMTPVGKLGVVQRNRTVIVRRFAHAVDLVVALLAFCLVLEVWRVYGTLSDAVDGVLSWGFSVGENQVTVGLALGALALLYGALLTSWALQAVLLEDGHPWRHVDHGARISINRLIHYALVLAGFLAALSHLGFDFQNLAILAGAFGIGIGFGLQTIVNNFVSGLILLFERPIKVGDVVWLDGEWARIQKLGLRATVVQTFDRADVIVPNSELIANKVTNWTLTDRLMRLSVPVGVAYGSNVPLVISVLEKVGLEHPNVAQTPAPQVMFQAFGGSSLDFELRVWLDVDQFMRVRSELHQEIDRRFREEHIEISFPQRDLHLRTVDERARKALLSVARGDGEEAGKLGS